MKGYRIISLILLVFSALANAQVMDQFRGEDRKGLYSETGLMKTWPVNGPQILWSVDFLGNGYGSPSFGPDRMYITGEHDSTAWLYCLDLNGKLIWKTSFGPEWVRSYPGSRSAPTVTKDYIYVSSGVGNIYCFDPHDGLVKWHRDLFKDFHGQPTLHGHAEAVLVDGDKVFFTPGGKDTNVVAMNRYTGAILWISRGRGERPGYNSPVLIRLPSRTLVAVFTAYELMGLDASNGDLLWFHVQDNLPIEKHDMGYGDTHSNSIWYEDGSIYYIAGDGNGAVKLKLSPDGKEIHEQWRNPIVDNYMGGFVKLGGNIFSCTSTGRDLVKINASSGAITDSLKCGAGSVISADGMLYYYNQRGEVMLINPSLTPMAIESKMKVNLGTKEHFAHPVIHKGVMYIRHGNALVAYKIKL